MSVTDRPSRPEPTEPSRATRPGGFSAWGPAALICALLVASGLVRSWQDRRLQDGMKQGRAAVVELSKVPLELGPWSGVDTKLDPEIARVTAADLIVTRLYTNRNTGVKLEVILLFGPSFTVSRHSPIVCYPSAGFTVAEPPHERLVEVDAPSPPRSGSRITAPFLSAVYAKGEGAQVNLEEVYWSWWYDGGWTPYVEDTKRLQRVPTIIKVHTARHVLRGERRDADNPNEAFLRLLLLEIERLLPSPRRAA